MAVKSDYVTGTITLTNGLSTFTGAGTAWQLAGFREGDEIKQIEGQTQWEAMVATITSNTAGTLVRPWGGATGTYAYRMRFQPDGSRVTAQARELIDLLGDGTLLSLAGLVGPGVIELLPGGGAQVVPKTDLVSGANYDVQVANMAARAAYDGQAAGFSVLVADVGDGRAAIYSKITNASGNWTAPAYVTGPTGPVSTVPGVVWRGTYAAGTTYAVNDGVTFNGSSFRKLTTAAAGTAPSAASPPVNTAAWEVLAAKGTNGTGTGDMVGPASSANNRIAVFDGLTGKLLKDGGITLDEKLTAAATALLQDRKPASTPSGSSIAGGWQIRTLNTEVYDPTNMVSLSGNEFTVAVDCECRYETAGYNCGNMKARLYNMTDNVLHDVSMVGFIANATTGITVGGTVSGVARLSAGKRYRLDMYTSTAQAGNGLGALTADGSSEVFSSVLLRRI